jgi:hypothetical protein
MTQTEQVINVMREKGGYSTLLELNHSVDVSSWKSKTPFASIRRIVQVGPFFKIRPGLWALNECRDKVLEKLNISPAKPKNNEIFTHGYYQGLLVQIGNFHKLQTYVPAQDKNRKFLETPLNEMITVHAMYEFTYPKIIGRAKTVDVIWFNSRNMPNSFFEVEHTTDIQNSLDKFYELQDFCASFNIVADSARYNQFKDIISRSIYDEIRKRVSFQSYEKVVENYTKFSALSEFDPNPAANYGSFR